MQIRLLYLFFCLLALSHCATSQLPEFTEVFKGNTKRDPADYSFKEKEEYRKYLFLKEVEKKQKDEEIIERLNDKNHRKKNR